MQCNIHVYDDTIYRIKLLTNVIFDEENISLPFFCKDRRWEVLIILYFEKKDFFTQRPHQENRSFMAFNLTTNPIGRKFDQKNGINSRQPAPVLLQNQKRNPATFPNRLIKCGFPSQIVNKMPQTLSNCKINNVSSEKN